MSDFLFDTTFELLDTCLGNGEPIPANWRPIPTQPLLILVGGMGVGKTTTIDNLMSVGAPFQLLPNRRDLTVKLIVWPQLRALGKPVRDLPRLERIPYIQRFQKRNPGGLAYAISGLSVAPYPCVGPLVFDGLRGADEIRFAVDALPLAQFVMLTTPDFVRVQRLLQRRDPYDKLGFDPPNVDSLTELRDFVSLGVPDARCLFTPEEEQALLNLARNGDVKMADLADKLSLIWAERGVYNLEATREAVLTLASERSLLIDTTHVTPEEVVQRVLRFMGERFS